MKEKLVKLKTPKEKKPKEKKVKEKKVKEKKPREKKLRERKHLFRKTEDAEKTPKAKKAGMFGFKSFKSKINALVIICTVVAVSLTLTVMIFNTKNMVIDSSLGQMLNIALSYGKIVDAAEEGEMLENEAYAEVLSDLKIDTMESSRCILLNRSGIITYHSDPAMIGKPNRIPFITTLLGQLNRGVVPENLSDSYEDDGETVYCSYHITAAKSVLIVCADGSELMKPLRNFSLQAAGVSMILLVVAILVSNILVSRITNPLKKVTNIILDASVLKLTLPENIDKLCASKDESGQICRAVKEMCLNLRQVVQQIESSSDSIRSNMEELEESSNQVHIFCTDNSATSQQLAASMVETSSMTDTINDYMLHMREQSNGINEEASRGTQLSEEVAQRARQLQETTLQAMENTTRIYESVKEKTDHAMAELAFVSKINELTDAIVEISDQTSLLSLNASIEAARAGDAGRGFSVVAKEISNLSHRSLESVKDINSIIAEVNTAVDNMSVVLSETLSFLEKTVLTDYDKFNRVGQQYMEDADIYSRSMQNISSEIQQLNTSIQQITTGIGEIQTTISDASIGVSDIAEKTSNTVDKASANYTLSSNTKEDVSTLKQIVDRFQL